MKLLVLLIVIIPNITLAAPMRLTLKDSIAQALEANKDLKAQRFQVIQAEADRDRVHGEFGTKVEGLLGLAPITKATGNAIVSTEDKGVWGRMYLGNLRFTQPLYAWGRKDDYLHAATNGKLVKQGETRLKENELRYLVKEAYYGSLYTNSLLDFISGGKQDIRKVLDETAAKKNAKKKEGYRLEILLREVEEKEAEVKKHNELAKAGLGLRIGSSEEVLPKEDWITLEERKLDSLETYLASAKNYRPEFQQLAQGIEAKRLLARAEKKALLPVLGLAVNYDFADTNVRPSQAGPFAYDPYNREQFSFGVGLKVDFAWALQKAKAARYVAEAEELEAKSAYAEDGIAVEIKQAYWEVVEAENRLISATQAYKLSKKWLNGEMMAFSAGLGKNEDLVDAYEIRAETVKNYFEAIFKHHMAWAALSKAVGTEVESNLQ